MSEVGRFAPADEPGFRRVDGRIERVGLKSELRTAFTIVAGLLVVGTLGYRWIEGWTLLDSLYMTVITLSTVGFGEPRPLSGPGKVFTGALILFGVGTLAYMATKTTEALVERRPFRTGRMRREIKRMRDHVIVCGYGRMGAAVVELLQVQGVPMVLVEKDPGVTRRLEQEGLCFVAGDATEDNVLGAAGVEHAKAMATVLPHDADNLFVTLTARRMNARLNIIARSSRRKNDSKMLAAGATRVLNPYDHGGRLMARQLLQPAVTEFIDAVSQWGADLGLEEVQLLEGSTLAGITLRDAPIRKEMDVIVVGIRRSGEGLIFNPPSDLAPRPGDVLIMLGRRENLRRMARLAAGEAPG